MSGNLVNVSLRMRPLDGGRQGTWSMSAGKGIQVSRGDALLGWKYRELYTIRSTPIEWAYEVPNSVMNPRQHVDDAALEAPRNMFLLPTGGLVCRPSCDSPGCGGNPWGRPRSCAASQPLSARAVQSASLLVDLAAGCPSRVFFLLCGEASKAPRDGCPRFFFLFRKAGFSLQLYRWLALIYP